jgi:drug/metabolite transporter (DMT)-like permease
VTEQNLRLGILYMVATTVVFAMQDVLSRHLAGIQRPDGRDDPLLVLRGLRRRRRRAAGGRAARGRGDPQQPLVQTPRGLLLPAEICVMVLAFTLIGLVESHAIFTTYPLLVAALSGPLLGEKVGWRRWTAIAIGFVGVLIILQPG